MSSIYDDSSKPKPGHQHPFTGQPFQPNEPYATPGSTPGTPAQKKSGCGCVGCLLGCLGVSVVVAIIAGIGMWYVVKKLPDMARQGIASVVEESELEDADKKMVMQQVDRLVDGYKQGKVDMQKLGKLTEEFVQSPLMDLLVAFAAKKNYIEPSGLSPEEKAEAEKTLHRVARGVIEEKITQEQLDVALNHISTKTPNGARQFKEKVTDEELRAFLSESKKLADDAMISDEDVKVDVGAELKKLVDKALGEVTEVPEVPAPKAPDAPVPPDVPPPAEKPDAEKPDAAKPE
jgi:hypothetical protein